MEIKARNCVPEKLIDSVTDKNGYKKQIMQSLIRELATDVFKDERLRVIRELPKSESDYMRDELTFEAKINVLSQTNSDIVLIGLDMLRSTLRKHFNKEPYAHVCDTLLSILTVAMIENTDSGTKGLHECAKALSYRGVPPHTIPPKHLAEAQERVFGVSNFINDI